MLYSWRVTCSSKAYSMLSDKRVVCMWDLDDRTVKVYMDKREVAQLPGKSASTFAT